MKRFIIFVSLLSLLIVQVSAAEDVYIDSSDTYTTEPSITTVTVSVPDTVTLDDSSINALSEAFSTSIAGINSDPSEDGSELTDISTFAVALQSSGSSSLKDIMLSLIGDYQPVVTIETYRQNNNTYNSYVTNISPDYAWICSCYVFMIILFCTLKIIGGFVCKI